MNKNNVTLVELICWVDNNQSNNYIDRLNNELNPSNSPFITTTMFNKEILSNVGTKVNTYNRFQIVFDFDETKEYQKVFSFSSPKQDDDPNHELFYYQLRSHTKVMLNCPIYIPTKYLIKANLRQMLQNETNNKIKMNLSANMRNLHLCVQNKKAILYQYDCIKNNTDVLKRFNPIDVEKAHNKMIDEEKAYSFCIKELNKD